MGYQDSKFPKPQGVGCISEASYTTAVKPLIKPSTYVIIYHQPLLMNLKPIPKQHRWSRGFSRAVVNPQCH